MAEIVGLYYQFSFNNGEGIKLNTNEGHGDKLKQFRATV